MTTAEERFLSALSILAVLCLAGFGTLLVAISLPPLFNVVFGQEGGRTWDAVGLANGLLYIATAVLIEAFRSRLGIGLGLILGLAGFGITFGVMVGWLSSGFLYGDFSRRELVIVAGLAAVNAVAILGALAAGRRWGFVRDPKRSTLLAAAILAGIGISLLFGAGGGAFAILMLRTVDADWLRVIEPWVVLPHFVAAVALALRGRLAGLVALAVSVGGMLVALAMIVTLAAFHAGPLHVLDSIALWTFYLLAYGLAAAVLVRDWRTARRGIEPLSRVPEPDPGPA